MTEPDDVREYKLQQYWDKRFEQEESYDWLVTFDQVSQLIKETCLSSSSSSDQPTAQSHLRVLVVGCGNSPFSQEIREAHPDWSIVSLDYSPVVIENMKKRYPEEPGRFEWVCGDMTRLKEAFAPGTFDAVIDKAAMDALVTDEGSPWEPKEEVQREVESMLKGVTALLRHHGVFVQISFQQVHFRVKYLRGRQEGENAYGWHVSHKIIESTKSLPHFFYICKKGQGQDA